MAHSSHYSSITPLTVLDLGKKIALLSMEHIGQERHLRLALSSGSASFKLERKKVRVLDGKTEEMLAHCQNFRLSRVDGSYLLMYEREKSKKKETVTAVSRNLFEFRLAAAGKKPGGSGFLVPDFRFEGNRILYLGRPTVTTAFSKDLASWKETHALLLSPRDHFFDSEPLRPVGVSLEGEHIIVLYESITRLKKREKLKIGAAAFARENPHKTIWRSEVPLFENDADGAAEGHTVGCVFRKKTITLIFATGKGELSFVTIENPFTNLKRQRKISSLLKRFSGNPIIKPSRRKWESEGTFNPAALYLDGRVHLIYRAVGENGLSVFGYAVSRDGYHIDERSPQPIYVPREPFEGVHEKPRGFSPVFASGGGWGGCEDPKLTFLEGRVYLTYVANSGWGPPRSAYSSIGKDDFLAKRWNWDKPKVVTPPNVIDKSLCLLPEKLAGRYVFFHRVFPNILIDYVDDLETLGEETGHFLLGEKQIPVRPAMWDSRKVSIGATPIRTKLGWLAIYHGVDDRDPSRYKVGAMILDQNDPSRVLYRTMNPIIKPSEQYENDWKPGVVYPTGAAVIDETLFIYYGGGDRVVCVATAPLDQFLDELRREITPEVKLRPSMII